jgi:hypothetical protein
MDGSRGFTDYLDAIAAPDLQNILVLSHAAN